MTTTVIPTYPKTPILAATGAATVILSCPQETFGFVVTASATPPTSPANFHFNEAGVPVEVILSAAKYLHVVTLNATSVIATLS